MANTAGLARLLLALVVIVVAARILGMIARRLGQPAVVGEIVAGILLGPTLAGGVITATIFPLDVRPALSTLADVGVCIFMFFVGQELDLELLRGRTRIVSTVSAGAILLPFGLGALLALHLAGPRSGVDRVAFVVLATLINTRGLTELIALEIGLQFGLLDQNLYSLMVLMALVTTAVTGVLLPLIYPPELVRQDIAERPAAERVKA